MKLVEIRFNNFRQFLGDQSFSFSLSEERPGNILYGANGSGKTTFLNGFTWALYGSFSDDVEEKTRLINNNAWKDVAIGDDGFAEVSLRFLHGGKSYKISRRVEATKVADSNAQNLRASEVSLTVVDQTQVPRVSDFPQREINTILPKNLAQFFFFNGERMENLVKNASYADVKKEVKGLLDLNQVERAVKGSLPKVQQMLKQDFRREDKGLAAQIEDDIEAVQTKLASLHDKQDELLKNIASNDNEISIIKNEQQKIEQIKPLLDEQKRLETEIEERKDFIKKMQERLDSAIQDHGYLAFMGRLLEVNAEKINELKLSGELPAPMSKEFLARLLSEETCVCGTPLTEGTMQRTRVSQASEAPLTTDSNKFFQRLEVNISSLEDSRASFQNNIQFTRQQLHDAEQKLLTAEAKRADIVTKLLNMNGEELSADPAKLQARIINLETEKRMSQRDRESLKANIQEAESELSTLKNKRNAAQTSGEIAERILSRIKLVEEITEALKEIYANRVERLLLFLNKKIRENYHKISHQNHDPYLNEEFEIGLKTGELGNIEVGKSTGENQVLTISFLAAVSEAAQERIKVGSNIEGLDPGEKEFPIVMDAAFGALDETYQTKVAELLASISGQLVILVSKSQGQGRVDKALKDYVSDRGVIVTFTSADNAANEEILIDGENHPYIVQGDVDCSKIMTVEAGRSDG